MGWPDKHLNLSYTLYPWALTDGFYSSMTSSIYFYLFHDPFVPHAIPHAARFVGSPSLSLRCHPTSPSPQERVTAELGSSAGNLKVWMTVAKCWVRCRGSIKLPQGWDRVIRSLPLLSRWPPPPSFTVTYQWKSPSSPLTFRAYASLLHDYPPPLPAQWGECGGVMPRSGGAYRQSWNPASAFAWLPGSPHAPRRCCSIFSAHCSRHLNLASLGMSAAIGGARRGITVLQTDLGMQQVGVTWCPLKQVVNACTYPSCRWIHHSISFPSQIRLGEIILLHYNQFINLIGQPTVIYGHHYRFLFSPIVKPCPYVTNFISYPCVPNISFSI